MKQRVRWITGQVLSTAWTGSLVGGVVLVYRGLVPMSRGDRGGDVEVYTLIFGVCVLLSAIPANLGIEVLRARWRLDEPRTDPVGAIRAHAFEGRAERPRVVARAAPIHHPLWTSLWRLLFGVALLDFIVGVGLVAYALLRGSSLQVGSAAFVLLLLGGSGMWWCRAALRRLAERARA
jgi:hypothetical protein